MCFDFCVQCRRGHSQNLEVAASIVERFEDVLGQQSPYVDRRTQSGHL